MQSALAAILAVIEAIAPGASSSVIATVITALEQLIPVIIDLSKELMPTVTNVINALKSNSSVTPDQLTALKAIEDQYDSDFEAAAQAAEAEDAASN